MNITKIAFSASNYCNESTQKKQIYLHHTAGNSSGEGVFKWWAQQPERIATFCAISGDGTIVQGFEPTKWAYHLGLGTKHFQAQGLTYMNLDKISIGIELCCWGQLTQSGNKFITYTDREVHPSDVIKLDAPFKGYEYWHSYTDAQIESLRNLLCHLHGQFNIPLHYNPSIFELSKDAFRGIAGLYTHNSVRKDKVDIYPHPKLIEMLKSL